MSVDPHGSLCWWCRRWQKRRPVLPQIYLPIGWSTYFFSAARVEPFQPEEVARARSEVRLAARQCLSCRR